jgi:hypothetical protein
MVTVLRTVFSSIGGAKIQSLCCQNVRHSYTTRQYLTDIKEYPISIRLNNWFEHQERKKAVGLKPIYGDRASAVFASQRGDCDSLSLAAATLLSYLGYNVSLVVSFSARHSVLGVHLPMRVNQGETITSNGVPYTLVEMTSPDLALGSMWSGFKNHDWFVVPIR